MPEVFCFEGFEPSPELKTFAKDVLWRAENRAPSQSFVKAKVIKTQDGFSATIDFSSQVGHFGAETQGTTPKAALTSLYSQIRKELLKWKKGRLDFI